MHRSLRVAALVAATATAACAQRPAIVSLHLPGDAGPEEVADPALAVDPATTDLLVSWVSGDSTGYAIRFARSSDGGSTWSAPVTVAGPTADIHPHGESAQRLVVSPGGTLAIVWSNNVPVTGRRWPASNIRLARSTDGGRTWSATRSLNDDSTGAPGGHLFHGAAFEGDSTLVVAWLDERQGSGAMTMPMPRAAEAAPIVGHEHEGGDAEPDAHIYQARSADLGATWPHANQPLWGTVCPCCRVSLARSPDGQVSLAWRKHYAGNVRDVVVAPLASAPAEPTRVHADEWVYPGCPHTGPAISVDAAGATHVAWFSGKEGAAGIYYARRPASGDAFSEPVALVRGRTLSASHVTVAARPGGGAYVAYDVRSDGFHVPLLTILDDNGAIVRQVALGTDDGADHPQVVTLKDGGAVVGWTQNGSRRTVRLVRVAPS